MINTVESYTDRTDTNVLSSTDYRGRRHETLRSGLVGFKSTRRRSVTNSLRPNDSVQTRILYSLTNLDTTLDLWRKVGQKEGRREEVNCSFDVVPEEYQTKILLDLIVCLSSNYKFSL